MPEVPSIAQNLLQQKYGQHKEPPPKEEFQAQAEKGILSRKAEAARREEKLREHVGSQKGRPSVILDLSDAAKKLLGKA